MAEGRALIFAGGSFDPHGLQAHVTAGRWDWVIAADSGARHAVASGHSLDLIVGDFDSIDPTLARQMASVPRQSFPRDKAKTDTHLALDWALDQGARHIVIAGGLGGRFDHSLANAQLLVRMHRTGARGVVTDGRQAVYLLAKSLHLESNRDLTLSVLPLTERCEGLSLRGLRWELTDVPLLMGETRTVSNELHGAVAELSLAVGLALVVVGPPD